MKQPSFELYSVKNADKQNGELLCFEWFCDVLLTSFGPTVVLLLEKTKQLPEPETVLQFIEQHKTNR